MGIISVTYWKSPVGEMIIGVYDHQVCICDWRYRKSRTSIDQRIQDKLQSRFVERELELHQKVILQLEEYFAKTRKVFDLPLFLVGTDFQYKIWKLLMNIPYGKTTSYLELSKQYGNTKAIRAVASANGANAISIIVPCHRVIGSNNDLVGYAGGLPAKKRLLEIENTIKETQFKLF